MKLSVDRNGRRTAGLCFSIRRREPDPIYSINPSTEASQPNSHISTVSRFGFPPTPSPRTENKSRSPAPESPTPTWLCSLIFPQVPPYLIVIPPSASHKQ